MCFLKLLLQLLQTSNTDLCRKRWWGWGRRWGDEELFRVVVLNTPYVCLIISTVHRSYTFHNIIINTFDKMASDLPVSFAPSRHWCQISPPWRSATAGPQTPAAVWSCPSGWRTWTKHNTQHITTSSLQNLSSEPQTTSCLDHKL